MTLTVADCSVSESIFFGGFDFDNDILQENEFRQNTVDMCNEAVAGMNILVSVMYTFVVEKGCVDTKHYPLFFSCVPRHIEVAVWSDATKRYESQGIFGESIVDEQHLDVEIAVKDGERMTDGAGAVTGHDCELCKLGIS